ncbi:MAG: hypothetical protein VCA73_01340 [Roseibacillus sp.]
MKLRVILQGLVVCTVVWTMVFAAQGYFQRLRLTAEKVEEFIEEADLADWAARENEPSGAEAEGRKKRIHEIADLLSKLDFAEGDRVRQKKVAYRFFGKLSPNEKGVFVQLVVRSKLELYMTAFDGLSEEKREKYLKKTQKELEYESVEGDLDPILTMLEKHHDALVADGVRSTVEAMSTEEVMEFSQAMQIMNELMQRVRMPNWEGRGE